MLFKINFLLLIYIYTMPTKKQIQERASKALKYGETLIGLEYKWWTGQDRDDFHYYDKPQDIPFIRKNGIACSGFANLLMHKVGVEMPKNKSKHRGGTGFWYRQFKKNKKLRDFDYHKDYPPGTMLFRKYRNVEDQGHIAILHSVSPGKLLYGKLIHAYADNSEGGKVGITIVGCSHFWEDGGGDEGYYEYAILPEDWLF
jgi:hypothetical protein